MQELKDKIQTAIGDFNGQLTNYNAGWKQCLITIQNQIDDELLKKEKEQISNAYTDGLEGPYIGAEEYYNQTYNKNK